MKNIPKTIYLITGIDDNSELEGVDFNDLTEVTWSSDKQYNCDIEYSLKQGKTIEEIVTFIGNKNIINNEMANMPNVPKKISDLYSMINLNNIGIINFINSKDVSNEENQS